MINMDEFMMVGIKPNPSEEELRRALAAWEHPTRFRKLDTISVTDLAMDRLVDPLETMEDKSSDLLENPSLPEFAVTVTESGPLANPGSTTVRFKKTVLTEPLRIGGENDSEIVWYPVVDGYISIDQTETVDVIMTIFSTRIRIDGKKEVTGTGQRIQWCNHENDRGLYVAVHQDDQDIMETFRDIKFMYLAIQRALKYRPTVFYTPTGRKQTGSGSGEYIPQKHVQHPVRMIRVDEEELKKYATPLRHMNCPCWGVIGHIRHYKSGREVWIKPYRKGRQRNNPEAYQAKEYRMED
jgi:hypothetical protein